MRYLIVLFYCLLALNLFAQKSSANKKAQQAYDQAAKHLRLNEFDLAIQQLKIAVQLDKSFATAYQQLADIYRKQEKYKLASSAYQQVIKLDPSLTPLTFFGLGESLLFTGNYTEASNALKTYQTKGNLTPKSSQLVNKYLQDCEFATQYVILNNVLRTKELPKEINSNNDEYFPQLTADNKTLIFTRKTNNQENFYESNFLNNHWTNATKLQGKINSDSYNEGAHCISPDGKYLFFTGCNRPDGLGSCDIYVSKKEKGNWSAPHNLGAPINSKGWEAQPSISADGKTLYFVSNRAGGFGGYDLYKSYLDENGDWSQPVNLGKNINTAFNESSPYIHADNHTLYFASDGWPGFGQKDIFKSKIDSLDNWSIPQNLGSQINNYADQMSMHVSMNGKIGHLSSQDTSGHYDIYSLLIPEESRPQPVAYILGTVLDATNKQPIGAVVSVTNTQSQRIVYKNNNDEQDGQFLATLPIGHNYAVHIEKKGYLFDSKQYNLTDEANDLKEFTQITYLAAIKTESKATLNNVYFDINKFDLLPTSLSDLQILLNFLSINTTVKIEIAGHTDHTGNKQHNQILSKKRAQAVVDFLIDNGINQQRLVAKGYGDAKPIASNETDEGRSQNRRTEIKIL